MVAEELRRRLRQAAVLALQPPPGRQSARSHICAQGLDHFGLSVKDIDKVVHPMSGIRPSYYGMFEDNDPSKRLVIVANYDNDVPEYWEWSGQGLFPFDQSNVPLSTTTPPMLVPCPPMNFVAEWTTMSAPHSIGRQR